MRRTTLPLGTFVNPLDGHFVIPGKVLGYRRDGRPIYAIAGGSGEGDDGTDTGDGGTDDDQDGSAGQDDDGKKAKIQGDYDPERAARAIAAAREAEKKAKAETKAERDRVAAILKAAGLTPDGKEDPEQKVKDLLARAEAAEAKARQADLKDAVRSGAAKHNGDAELLLDSQRFLGKLADLDTTANDFGDKVADLVKAEVKANPRYAATAGQGPGKQGADHNGAGGGKSKPKNLTEAITAKLGG